MGYGKSMTGYQGKGGGGVKKITPGNNPKIRKGPAQEGTSVARGGRGNAEHNRYGRTGMPNGKGRSATGF